MLCQASFLLGLPPSGQTASSAVYFTSAAARASGLTRNLQPTDAYCKAASCDALYIRAGGLEMGQGLSTKVLQVSSEPSKPRDLAYPLPLCSYLDAFDVVSA